MSALGSIAAASSAAGDLDQAQVRPIGVLAHELGVHGDEGLLGEALDEGDEIVGLGDQWMNIHEFAAGHSGLSAG